MAKINVPMKQNLLRLFNAYFKQDDEAFIKLIKKSFDSVHFLNEERLPYEMIFEQVRSSYREGSYVPSSVKSGSPHAGTLQQTAARDEWKKRHGATIQKKHSTSETDKLFLPVNIMKKVEALENQYLYRKNLEDRGLQVMNRVLLVGAPGGGKTSLAKQISLDLNLNMDSHSIASIIDSALGGTGKQIHNIFKSVSTEMLFLDEFDAIGASREQGNDLGEMRRVVNVLLQEMDSLSPDTLLIAATNFPKKLDSAVLRRFSSIIELPKPDINQRVRYMQEFSVEHKISIENTEILRTAKITDGLSYADLKSFMMNFAIAKVSGYSGALQLSKYYIEELSMRQTINDRVFAKWVKDKSISITDLSEVLDVPRTTLSDRLKRVSGNYEKE